MLLLKVAFALFESWSIISQELSNGRIKLVMIFYYILIVKLFIDVLKAVNNKHKVNQSESQAH